MPHRTATIFRAVAEVEEYSQFLPWCVSSRVLDKAVDDATGESNLLTEITVGYKSMSSTLNSRVKVEPMSRVSSESDANEYIEHLSFTWDFRSVGEQTCRLDLMLGARPSRSCREHRARVALLRSPPHASPLSSAQTSACATASTC